MQTVTQRIKAIKQPYGGYIKPSTLKKIVRNDGIVLGEENISGITIGTTVDYLTRLVMGADVREAFKISLKDAFAAQKMVPFNAQKVAETLISGIKGIDKQSIINACKLVSFDVWYRNPNDAILVTYDYSSINPDQSTISNIQTLVKRSISFFEEYGPVTADGFDFSPEALDELAFLEMLVTGTGSYGGYTSTVYKGDGDFLTKDTLWDFKVSKSAPTSKHTLQLLMYWIMGQHSGQKIFKGITRLGIFNPRLNIVYLYDVKDIPDEVIEAVEKDVICYD